MKIGLIARFFDLRNGGIGRFSMEMLNALNKRGYDVVPVSTNREGTSGHVIYSLMDLAFMLPRGCDIYHCLTPMEAIYSPKNISVVTFHDFIPWKHVNDVETHYVGGSMRKLKGWMSKSVFAFSTKIAAGCSLVACNSEQTRKEVIEFLHLDESKVSVVRFGISRNLKPGTKKDSKYRIGTLSYLDQRKRIGLLIKAFLEADVDGELVIGGTGVAYPRLKEMAKGDQRIKFLGFIPEEQQTDFYNSLDLFVFPSKIEGYGLPIVEAFACGKPVVILRDAIIPDEIKSRCTVVDDLADFLKIPKPNQRVEANYAFAKLHNWDTCVDEYINLYRRLLNA
jgi:glycosyltransferase involved in cell wall biosynthesis